MLIFFISQTRAVFLLIFQIDADRYSKNPSKSILYFGWLVVFVWVFVCMWLFCGASIMVKTCLNCSGRCWARLAWNFSSPALGSEKQLQKQIPASTEVPVSTSRNLLFWINCCFHVLFFLTATTLSVCLFSFQITNWAFHLQYEGHYQGISS